MTANSIFYALIGLTTAITLRYLNKATHNSIIPDEKGKFLLRMHKVYSIVGYISLVLCLVLTIGLIITGENDLFMYILAFLMFLLFGGLGLLSVFFYHNHYVRFDNSTIEVRNVFGKIKHTSWSSIKKASFNPGSGILTLVDNSGQKLRIHQHLIGLSQFVTFLEDNTQWTSKNLKFPVKRNK